MMTKKRIAVGLVVIIAMLAINLAACSKKKEPTNADIVRAAIQRAVSENCNIFSPSIGVVTKTSSGDGSWTYRVRYECGGLANAGKQQEMTLRLVPSEDSSGRPGWEAK